MKNKLYKIIPVRFSTKYTPVASTINMKNVNELTHTWWQWRNKVWGSKIV